MFNDVTVFNIREYLSAKGDKDLGEDELRQLLSEFFCDKNPAVETIKGLQYMAGGMVIFLEAEDNDKLMLFYEDENGFKRFDVREAKSGVHDSHTLIQLLKII